MYRILRTSGIALLVMMLLGAPGALAKKGPPGSGPACPTGSAQVVLDPGHGGSDTGAYNSTYGVYEKNLTLDIAFKAQSLLKGAGYTVALTRSTDIDLGNSERGEIANACGASVFVEIHLNGSSDPSVDYTQTFWGQKRKDQAFAGTMDGAMAGLTGEDGGPIANNGVGQFANGGLLTATMPSTLVEAVFLTNNWEANGLVNGNREDEIASAIAAGVESWVG